MYDNYSKLKRIRKNNECLFRGVEFECKSQGKCKTEENHIIPRASYLERISHRGKVLVFDFENRDYIKNGRKLVERKIIKANRFHVLCGTHDKNLFDEIENSKIFDENNKKQLFQFALRAFIFSLSEERMKDNFDNIMKDSITNKVAEVHLGNNNERLKTYQNLFLNQKWDGIETRVIKLNRESRFISCVYRTPNYGFIFPVRFNNCGISFNVFPNDNKTIVLLSYLKGDLMSKSAERFCDKLVNLAENKEERFVRYMNKFIAAFDHNIAIDPEFWKNLNEKEQREFYEIAHIFPKCKTLISGCIGFINLKLKIKAPKLIL